MERPVPLSLPYVCSSTVSCLWRQSYVTAQRAGVKQTARECIQRARAAGWPSSRARHLPAPLHCVQH
ncbi:MAG: hypothetical protein VR75_14785 [Hyphomonadaceae bacterium BRH_c29]|nr:MAG: hypothetical protein VR75_14785 [Hyphomonadaceae bacterium BRH_c29]